MLILRGEQKVERVVCLITSLSPFVYLCICFFIFVFVTLREEQRVEQVVCLITGLGPLG